VNRSRSRIHTVEAARDILLIQLSVDTLKELARLDEDQLPDCHYGLGMRIRNVLELPNRADK